MRPHRLLLVLLALLLLPASARSFDRLVLPGDTSPRDNRWDFPIQVLIRAMETTMPDDGPYCIGRYRQPMHYKRALRELREGKLINVTIAPARKEWNEQAIAVPIPVFMGLHDYRLLLINRQMLDRFREVRTIDDLRALRCGMVYQWSGVATMEQAGCSLVKAESYEGLFAMLRARRSDYVPRGPADIYAELEARGTDNPDFCVEPTLVLWTPSPQYVYVSPAHPHLADRIRRGMQALVDDGTLARMFHERYDEPIRRADLAHRRIIRIDNPLLPEDTPLNDPRLWFRP